MHLTYLKINILQLQTSSPDSSVSYTNTREFLIITSFEKVKERKKQSAVHMPECEPMMFVMRKSAKLNINHFLKSFSIPPVNGFAGLALRT